MLPTNSGQKTFEKTFDNEDDLFDRLENYCSSGYIPMHMPGHKRNTQLIDTGNPYGIDITEIDGFDNLHHPDGFLKEAQERAAQYYDAAKTWYLVSGSSIGLMSAILGVTSRHDTVLVARNCHISVYNAIYENELNPQYIYPKFVDNLWISSGILSNDVEKALKNCVKNKKGSGKVGAVIITSPTYEGNVSDIRAIADVVHKYGVPLIVDEAHGAHFKYSEKFPQSALGLGADVVVQSLHKTLPSLTQTALLHVGREAVNKKRLIADIDRYLNMFQSTSPSYILMGSINRCIRLMNSERGRAVMDNYTKELEKLRRRLEKLRVIKLAKSDDISKLVIYTEDGCLQGKQLYDILLKRYRIQLEMASLRYVIAMTGPGDTKEYYDRFYDALCEIDKELAGRSGTSDIGSSETVNISRPVIKMNLYDAVNCEDKESVEYHDACGRVSASTVCIYPPGIPLVCPGEVINRNMIDTVDNAFRDGLDVMGLEGLEAGLCGAAQDERKIVKILCLR